MTGLDDLQADLDALAGATDVIADAVSIYRSPERFQVDADALRDIADRLRNLLTDRDLGVPPLTSEIIAHKKAGGKAEHFAMGRWGPSVMSIACWQGQLKDYGDLRQHGERLVYPVPPQTERVRLDQLIGRDTMWNGRRRRIVGVDTSNGVFKLAGMSGWQDAHADGTVEVLKDGGK